MPPLGTTAGPFKFLPFVGNALSGAAGFAVGTAVGPTLRPLVQDLGNRAWSEHPTRPVDPQLLAEGVAQGQVAYDWAKNEAALSGTSGDRFDRMVDVADTGPGVATAFQLWRRGILNVEGFRRAAKREGLEAEWIDALVGLHDLLLTPDVLANARQQGFVTPARQLAESALQGVTDDRAEILFQLSGLPLGVETMQQALNRGLIDRATFDQAIREGHTKTKYTDLAEALRHPLLSADEYATLHLKGWIDTAAMNAGGALHGFTPEQMNLKYLERGRPAAPGQLWTAAARGIDGQDGRPMDRPQFLEAIKQSDIRPEYGPLLWDIRYLYPSLFQLTRLVSSQTIAPDVGADWARKARYAPEVVTALRKSWEAPTAGKEDPWVKRAETQLWSTTHKTYLEGDADETVARDKLKTLGVSAAAQARIILLWNEERELVRKRLTPAQLKKAFAKVVVNQATGQPFTRDEIVAELVSRGYTVAEANEYLDIP